MKIEKYKKMSRGRYKITFDSGEYIIYEDVIINNNLLLIKEVDIKLLEKILAENIEYECYDLALSYIDIKLRTEKEIYDYLYKKGFENELISKIVKKLKNNNFIDEKKYIEAYINDKINLTNWGPYKIKKSLLDLGIDENRINDYLDTIDNKIWEDKINKILDKRIKSLKNKSKYMIKNKLNIELYELGYDKELIHSSINNINIDEKDAIKKEVSNLYDKLSKKYSGYELKKQIKNHLYKKGFCVNDIDYEFLE